MRLEIGYISRVEGEAAVRLEIEGGRLKDLKLNIWEPPRFFEGFLIGRRFDEVPDIVARICGICPVSHMTTAIRAMDKALGIALPPEAARMREIMAWSQLVSSHLVHLYMLAMPDYYGLGSIAAMLPRFEVDIRRLLRMKDALNAVTAALGGRALHPVSMVVGGFTKSPGRDAVGKLIKGLDAIRDDALETLKVVAALPFPEFSAEMHYAAIDDGDKYAINEGRVVSSGGIDAPEDDYALHFSEKQVPYANAKRTTAIGGGTLMVGALARLNLKFRRLRPEAREAAASAGFEPPSHNPFHNIIAQAIEVVHGVGECIELLSGLEGRSPLADIRVREGRGTAVTEAPRGLLHHSYEINRLGLVEKANIVTPTAHNFLGLEENLRKLVKEHIDEPPEELSAKCEMLVRAYDPCFSCSVH
jgi:sulfhydrogenase subunit alpha